MAVLLSVLITIVNISYISGWHDEVLQKVKLRDTISEECDRKTAGNIVRDIKKFPVAQREAEKCYFDNGYGASRTYGGERKHQGIDIMSADNVPGKLPIQSVSDGVIENIGWLKLGGYRIGVRSKSGIYYYYAHLDSYADGIIKKKHVKAGDILGYMGNTGYGPEGTKGKFDVHLHFGIYIDKKCKESINPYYSLKYIENHEY